MHFYGRCPEAATLTLLQACAVLCHTCPAADICSFCPMLLSCCPTPVLADSVAAFTYAYLLSGRLLVLYGVQSAVLLESTCGACSLMSCVCL